VSPTESEIISQMEKLISYEYSHTSTKSEDLVAWAGNILNIFRLFLYSQSPQIQLLEKTLNAFLSEEIFKSDKKGKIFTIFKGILISTYSDYKKGFLRDLRAEIRSEIDVDFFAQAKRLLDDKLKDAAAMIIGAVLEDTLRQLCKKHGVPEGPKIESMNAPLKQAGVYNSVVQKQITTWADIRNKADHAIFDQYDINEVKLMHQGVTDFIAKYLT
jgi:hypothetical protein